MSIVCLSTARYLPSPSFLPFLPSVMSTLHIHSTIPVHTGYPIASDHKYQLVGPSLDPNLVVAMMSAYYALKMKEAEAQTDDWPAPPIGVIIDEPVQMKPTVVEPESRVESEFVFDCAEEYGISGSDLLYEEEYNNYIDTILDADYDY
jgi:hypothetical protein